MTATAIRVSTNAPAIGDALRRTGTVASRRAAVLTRQYGVVLTRTIVANASGRPGPRRVTGDYARSWRTTFGSLAGVATSVSSTNKPQAARLEYGFVGVDSAGRHYCADEQTEVLTQRGWMSHSGLTTDDVVLTLNPESWLAEWQPVLAVNRFAGEFMLTVIEGRTLSCAVTADHRWLTERYYARAREWRREWRTTDTLRSNHRIPLAQKRGDAPSLSAIDDDVVELAAWFWTEGAYDWSRQWSNGKRRATQRPIGLRLSQSDAVNQANGDRIRRLLTRMFGPPGRYADGAHWNERVNRTTGVVTYRLDRIAPWLMACCIDAPAKVLRPDFLCSLTAEQLDLLIDVSLAADGHVSPDGVTRLTQADEGRIRAFEMACALAGRPTVTRVAHREIAGRTVPCWATTVLRTHYSHAIGSAMRVDRDSAQAEQRPYAGTVWCPTTTNGTWLARRNGTVYFTGNSQPPYPHVGPAIAAVEPQYAAALGALARSLW